MAYRHIDNLYKAQEILLFKECYAMEKIHGTSAHVSWNGAVCFYSGGVAHDKFVALFDQAALLARFTEIGQGEVVVYGEAYGGKCQRMGKVYGPALRFVVFEVKIGDSWLAVPQAEDVTKKLGLEFVHYRRIPAEMADINDELTKFSVQAVRNGADASHEREGIVLRPLIELRKNNGERIMCKHKNDAYQERKTPQPVVDPEKWKVLQEANAIADEWVTPTRLTHVLDKLPLPAAIEQTRGVIDAMVEDVVREAKGEIVDSQDARRAIARKTAQLFHAKLRSMLHAELPQTEKAPNDVD